MDQRDAEPIVKHNKARKMNLNDLKASRKAMENELADLNALTEMDDVQNARFADLVGKIDDVTKNIELKEKAAEQLKARAVAGEAVSKGEEKEISKLKKRFSITGERSRFDGRQRFVRCCDGNENRSSSPRSSRARDCYPGEFPTCRRC